MKRATTALLCLAILAGAASIAPGQDGADVKLGDGRGKVILTWDEFVKITGYDPSKKGSQVLTIPWSEVEKLLGVDAIERVGAGTTVDLPWEEFKALLEWSLRNKDIDDDPPPVDAVVKSCKLSGALTDDGGVFVMELKLNVLRKKGWKRIGILPLDVALTKADLPKGVFMEMHDRHYVLLTAASGEMDVKLEFSVAASSSGGVNRLSFQRIDCPAVVEFHLSVYPGVELNQ